MWLSNTYVKKSVTEAGFLHFNGKLYFSENVINSLGNLIIIIKNIKYRHLFLYSFYKKFSCHIKSFHIDAYLTTYMPRAMCICDRPIPAYISAYWYISQAPVERHQSQPALSKHITQTLNDTSPNTIETVAQQTHKGQKEKKKQRKRENWQRVINMSTHTDVSSCRFVKLVSCGLWFWWCIIIMHPKLFIMLWTTAGEKYTRQDIIQFKGPDTPAQWVCGSNGFMAAFWPIEHVESAVAHQCEESLWLAAQVSWWVHIESRGHASCGLSHGTLFQQKSAR